MKSALPNENVSTVAVEVFKQIVNLQGRLKPSLSDEYRGRKLETKQKLLHSLGYHHLIRRFQGLIVEQ